MGLSLQLPCEIGSYCRVAIHNQATHLDLFRENAFLKGGRGLRLGLSVLRLKRKISV